MIKIAYTGTHGTGKTDSAFKQALELKRANPDKHVEILAEVARQAPKINKDSNITTQLWILTKQINAEIEASMRSDILVCDRTAMDCVAYTSYFIDREWKDKLSCRKDECDATASVMYDMACTWLHTYDTIYFKLAKNNEYCFSDTHRDITPEYRQGVEDILLKFYKAYQQFQQQHTTPALVYI